MINMKQLFQKTMCEQIQESLDKPGELSKQSTPKTGWIKVIRQALGMTSYQLAKRANCTQSNIMALERREKAGTISINSLNQAAKAMNCRVVYFFVPEKTLNQVMDDQAHLIAKKQLQAVSHSMALEQQAITKQQTKEQEDSLAKELLNGNPKHLWEG